MSMCMSIRAAAAINKLFIRTSISSSAVRRRRAINGFCNERGYEYMWWHWLLFSSAPFEQSSSPSHTQCWGMHCAESSQRKVPPAHVVSQEGCDSSVEKNKRK